eukprot:GHVS01078889.1.p1 GENE.GHVS01078889.1~~GHVS01078889.1.p1  ORF type:complete len:953 (+),score=182.10 GHVS01078889.1:28-2859(+)
MTPYLLLLFSLFLLMVPSPFVANPADDVLHHSPSSIVISPDIVCPTGWYLSPSSTPVEPATSSDFVRGSSPSLVCTISTPALPFCEPPYNLLHRTSSPRCVWHQELPQLPVCPPPTVPSASSVVSLEGSCSRKVLVPKTCPAGAIAISSDVCASISTPVSSCPEGSLRGSLNPDVCLFVESQSSPKPKCGPHQTFTAKDGTCVEVHRKPAHIECSEDGRKWRLEGLSCFQQVGATIISPEEHFTGDDSLAEWHVKVEGKTEMHHHELPSPHQLHPYPPPPHQLHPYPPHQSYPLGEHAHVAPAHFSPSPPLPHPPIHTLSTGDDFDVYVHQQHETNEEQQPPSRRLMLSPLNFLDTHGTPSAVVTPTAIHLFGKENAPPVAIHGPVQVSCPPHFHLVGDVGVCESRYSVAAQVMCDVGDELDWVELLCLGNAGGLPPLLDCAGSSVLDALAEGGNVYDLGADDHVNDLGEQGASNDGNDNVQVDGNLRRLGPFIPEKEAILVDPFMGKDNNKHVGKVPAVQQELHHKLVHDDISYPHPLHHPDHEMYPRQHPELPPMHGVAGVALPPLSIMHSPASARHYPISAHSPTPFGHPSSHHIPTPVRSMYPTNVNLSCFIATQPIFLCPPGTRRQEGRNGMECLLEFAAVCPVPGCEQEESADAERWECPVGMTVLLPKAIGRVYEEGVNRIGGRSGVRKFEKEETVGGVLSEGINRRSRREDRARYPVDVWDGQQEEEEEPAAVEEEEDIQEEEVDIQEEGEEEGEAGYEEDIIGVFAVGRNRAFSLMEAEQANNTPSEDIPPMAVLPDMAQLPSSVPASLQLPPDALLDRLAGYPRASAMGAERFYLSQRGDGEWEYQGEDGVADRVATAGSTADRGRRLGPLAQQHLQRFLCESTDEVSVKFRCHENAMLKLVGSKCVGVEPAKMQCPVGWTLEANGHCRVNVE